MKFKIRYADQIVGSLAILALLALFVVIFMLGSKQRWFARDYQYTSRFETASGLSVGMPMLYKGFTVGKIKSFRLNDDNLVDVVFYIYDTYYSRVKEGSLIELIINPIGLGNQLLFHPGLGQSLIEEGSFIPRADSPEGRLLLESGLALIPRRDDTIANLIAQVNPLLTNLNTTLDQVNGAFSGSGRGPLAETMTGVSRTMTNAAGITEDLYRSLDGILTDVRTLTTNLGEMSTYLADPTGLVPTLIDPEGVMFDSIEGSLKAVEGTLRNVEDSSSILKSQVPQIARLIEDLRIALVQGQDVLEALRNNPILKGGVPERVKTDSSGTNSRRIDF